MNEIWDQVGVIILCNLLLAFGMAICWLRVDVKDLKKRIADIEKRR